MGINELFNDISEAFRNYNSNSASQNSLTKEQTFAKNVNDLFQSFAQKLCNVAASSIESDTHLLMEQFTVEMGPEKTLDGKAKLLEKIQLLVLENLPPIRNRDQIFSKNIEISQLNRMRKLSTNVPIEALDHFELFRRKLENFRPKRTCCLKFA